MIAPQKEYKCSTCGKPLPEGISTPTFPFCCKRCKMTDLGKWFNGMYEISEPLPPDDEDYYDDIQDETGFGQN